MSFKRCAKNILTTGLGLIMAGCVTIQEAPHSGHLTRYTPTDDGDIVYSLTQLDKRTGDIKAVSTCRADGLAGATLIDTGTLRSWEVDGNKAAISDYQGDKNLILRGQEITGYRIGTPESTFFMSDVFAPSFSPDEVRKKVRMGQDLCRGIIQKSQATGIRVGEPVQIGDGIYTVTRSTDGGPSVFSHLPTSTP